MEPMDTSRGEQATGGGDQRKEPGLKPRDGDRRGEGGLFGGYDGPDRRSGSDRRANG